MDYTNSPQNNMQPDESNYKFLADLYGTFDGSYIPTNESLVESSAAIPPRDPSEEGPSDIVEAEPKDNPHRTRDRLLSETEKTVQRRQMMLLSDELDTLFDAQNIQRTRNSHRLLRSSNFVEKYEVDLGEGYTVQFHMLLARS
jgi:hypothetical protein